MAVILSSCLACGQPFAQNRELAAIPDAVKVAFDPARGRVWRICTACDEWNLLGAEAAAAALPELETRFAAAPKRPGAAGFAPAHVSATLDLLQIGNASHGRTDDVAIQRHRRRVQWIQRIGAVVLVACGLALIADIAWMYQLGDLARNIFQCVGAGGFAGLAFIAVRRRHRLPIQRPAVALAALAAIIGTAVEFTFEPNMYGVIWLATMLVFNTILALVLPPFSHMTVSLSGGRVLKLYSSNDVKRLSVSWNADDELTVHDLPNGAEITGADAVAILRRWSRGQVNYLRRSPSDAAYDLVRTAGGLHGLLRALEGFRRDRDGRIVLTDLPKVYRMALDLALSDAGNDSDSLSGLRRRALVAAEVAGEAEKLDKTR